MSQTRETRQFSLYKMVKKHELAQIIDKTTDDLRDAGLSPTGSEVEYRHPTELWGYIWLERTPADSIDDRKERATELLRTRINADADRLTRLVNISYGDAGEYGIAVWWSHL